MEIYLPIVALAAYFLKGATGFGPALLIIPIGSLLIGSKSAIIVSAMLDVVAGGYLLYLDPIRSGRRFWLYIAAPMVLGALIGSAFLEKLPDQIFTPLLGVIIFCIGIWLIFFRHRKATLLQTRLPSRGSALDCGVGLLAGISDGLFGISGPIIVFYLGHRFVKRLFRQMMIAIFLMTAAARTTAYTLTGIIDLRLLTICLISIPALFLGIYLGNRLFFKLSEIWFSRVAGALLMAIAIRLIIW
ncbi:MAG: hypothetical protein B6244_09175 [Candidatus Cloacimonetes bacterium 4572_55]|nr:MAG: hypothetical protein B6244_09175 [Candidatus Cloacimonetes bacterium 4572_55]